MTKKYVFNKTGDADVLELTDVQVPAPKAGEVQIRVKAIGLNRAEIMYRTGQYVIDPVFPAQLGYEAAGTVEAVGQGVEHVSVGDAVSVIPGFAFTEYGMYGELVNAPARVVVRHPEKISFEAAAAAWMMYTTAYGALIEFGNLKSGQTVLIRAASSSVGLAAIQIANMIGARPIAITRGPSKRDALLEAGASAVICTDEEELYLAIMRLTDSKGAQMVFDPVGGPEAAHLIRSLTMGGIFFQYGALDMRDIPVSVMDLLGKNLTIRGYELFEISKDDARLARAQDFIYKGLESGALVPKIDHVFDFSDMVAAHRHMEGNTQIGKLVVRF
ncbi:zinc-dependent alcohol dehydrogenase family protein [Agrobacterium sp. MOPV5]|uniref:zinc-dependent alcohol dehydrogenase family protein n=1 Tax=Agrobacterium leguminum TaxID=2792015 RepID=UPI0018C1F32E|nr:zinc-dependent alcohol dehydrogenase family protein [Agrobacterium leguminum]MBG0512129.1 zinc-dependent alcohol dehydrogenase family protein [Agrobacterium leguminum]